jgi:hypothetical protein
MLLRKAGNLVPGMVVKPFIDERGWLLGAIGKPAGRPQTVNLTLQDRHETKAIVLFEDDLIEVIGLAASDCATLD